MVCCQRVFKNILLIHLPSYFSLSSRSRLVLQLERKNITDERQALSDALTKLEQEGLSSTPFLSAQDNIPNLGDISVFGTLRGLEGLQVFDNVMSQHDKYLAPWYERMSQLAPRQKK